MTVEYVVSFEFVACGCGCRGRNAGEKCPSIPPLTPQGDSRKEVCLHFLGESERLLFYLSEKPRPKHVETMGNEGKHATTFRVGPSDTGQELIGRIPRHQTQRRRAARATDGIMAKSAASEPTSENMANKHTRNASKHRHIQHKYHTQSIHKTEKQTYHTQKQQKSTNKQANKPQ